MKAQLLLDNMKDMKNDAIFSNIYRVVANMASDGTDLSDDDVASIMNIININTQVTYSERVRKESEKISSGMDFFKINNDWSSLLKVSEDAQKRALEVVENTDEFYKTSMTESISVDMEFSRLPLADRLQMMEDYKVKIGE